MTRFLVIVNCLSAVFNNTPLVSASKRILHALFNRFSAGCSHDAHREGLGPFAELSKADAPASFLSFLPSLSRFLFSFFLSLAVMIPANNPYFRKTLTPSMQIKVPYSPLIRRHHGWHADHHRQATQRYPTHSRHLKEKCHYVVNAAIGLFI
jgi:hypothetical protein